MSNRLESEIQLLNRGETQLNTLVYLTEHVRIVLKNAGMVCIILHSESTQSGTIVWSGGGAWAVTVYCLAELSLKLLHLQQMYACVQWNLSITYKLHGTNAFCSLHGVSLTWRFNLYSYNAQ